MEESRYLKFEYWKKQKKNNFPDIIGTDYDIDSIDEETVFLWTAMSGPPPCSGGVGMWELAPNNEALTGYIRFVSLPRFFETWLKRDEWDDGEELIQIEDLFSKAEKIDDLKYKEDIPLMKEIIEEVDSAFILPNNKKFERIKSALDKFNHRWNKTGTWAFEIDIYKDATEVGEKLFNSSSDQIEDIYCEYYEEEKTVDIDEKITKEKWLEICNGIYLDEDDLDLFLSVLESSNYS